MSAHFRACNVLFWMYLSQSCTHVSNCASTAMLLLHENNRTQYLCICSRASFLLSTGLLWRLRVCIVILTALLSNLNVTNHWIERSRYKNFVGNDLFQLVFHCNNATENSVSNAISITAKQIFICTWLQVLCTQQVKAATLAASSALLCAIGWKDMCFRH